VRRPEVIAAAAILVAVALAVATTTWVERSLRELDAAVAASAPPPPADLSYEDALRTVLRRERARRRAARAAGPESRYGMPEPPLLDDMVEELGGAPDVGPAAWCDLAEAVTRMCAILEMRLPAGIPATRELGPSDRDLGPLEEKLVHGWTAIHYERHRGLKALAKHAASAAGAAGFLERAKVALAWRRYDAALRAAAAEARETAPDLERLAAAMGTFRRFPLVSLADPPDLARVVRDEAELRERFRALRATIQALRAEVERPLVR
jgi:hypothetical protein